MVKTLLKKQMLESFSWLFYNAKSGKLRKGIGLLGNILLYVAVFGIVAAMFFVMALELCEPLVAIGYGWLYFAIIGMVAIVLGAFGSVFNTHSTLYLAKDNDLLLALPIPVSKILFARISGVYLMGLMYELIAMVPALIIWFVYADLTVLGVIFSLLIPFVLSVFVLTLSCVLGWVVALVSSKIKNKSFITVILSLAFIAAYYFFYMRAYEMLMSIVTNAEAVGGRNMHLVRIHREEERILVLSQVGDSMGEIVASYHKPGEIVTIDAKTRPGYIFDRWQVGIEYTELTPVNESGSISTFIMPEQNQRIQVIWKRAGDFVGVNGLSLSDNEISMNAGDTKTITAKITPDNASDKVVIWTSSNYSCHIIIFISESTKSKIISHLIHLHIV